MKQGFSHLATILLAGLATGHAALADDARPGEGVTIRPVQSTLEEDFFKYMILYDALEELGYTVAEPFEVNYQALHLAIATGDADFAAVHSRPVHDDFYTESGGDAVMERLGEYIGGGVQSYLVDKKSYDAGITNIAQLKDPKIAARFDYDGNGKANLAGCPPGWGCEQVIEHHLDTYGLRDTVEHDQGTYEAVITNTIALHGSGESVLYYTWTPYWVSALLVPGRDVEMLEVPFTAIPHADPQPDTLYQGKNVGFVPFSLWTIGNKQFLAENPAARKLLQVASVSAADVSQQVLKMQEGADSMDDFREQVDAWKAAHKPEFDDWIAQARAAAKE